MHLLLQILEEGTVTDNFGRKIDFRNTVIILTSNAGAELVKKQTNLGFGAMGSDNEEGEEGEGDYESMKEKIVEQAKKVFKPEFLNRLDELVVFHMLKKSVLVEIVDLEIKKLVSRLADKDITVTLDQSAKEYLIEKGYDPSYGARPMRRAVERHLEDPLAEALLRGDIAPGETIKVRHKKNAEELAITSKKGSGDSKQAAASKEGM